MQSVYLALAYIYICQSISAKSISNYKIFLYQFYVESMEVVKLNQRIQPPGQDLPRCVVSAEATSHHPPASFDELALFEAVIPGRN